MNARFFSAAYLICCSTWFRQNEEQHEIAGAVGHPGTWPGLFQSVGQVLDRSRGLSGLCRDIFWVNFLGQSLHFFDSESCDPCCLKIFNHNTSLEVISQHNSTNNVSIVIQSSKIWYWRKCEIFYSPFNSMT